MNHLFPSVWQRCQTLATLCLANVRTTATTLLLFMALGALAQPAAVTHPWQHRRVAYLGDSLTDPFNKASQTKYWAFLEDWLDMTPLVYGRSGRQWNALVEQARKLQAEQEDRFDAIIIFAGTNDFNNGVPIGQWFQETDEQVLAAVHAPQGMVVRRKRTPVLCDSTFCGRINTALSTIKQLFPTKQIVLLTPIHRAFARFSDNNIQPSEAYQNACGEYADAYVQALKEAGNIWSVPVIDLNSVSGLYPLMQAHEQYFHDAETDLLHPNDAGQKRIARTLYYQLLTIPCVF